MLPLTSTYTCTLPPAGTGRSCGLNGRIPAVCANPIRRSRGACHGSIKVSFACRSRRMASPDSSTRRSTCRRFALRFKALACAS